MPDLIAIHAVLAQALPGLDQIIGTFLTQGVIGVACVILAFAYFRKDAALQAAHAARIADAKEFSDILSEHSKATAVNTSTLQGLATLIQTSRRTR